MIPTAINEGMSTLTTTPTPGVTSSVVTSSVVTTSRATICRRHSCQPTTPTNPIVSDDSGPSSDIGLKVGVSVGSVIVVALIALGYILLTRHRRKRLLNDHQPLSSPATDFELEAAGKIYAKKHLPELPVPVSRAELEGTPVRERGAGIYVWKPELEGTAGTPGALGVYVMKKSELEAKHNGAARPAPGAGARKTRTPYESPIIGPSFARYSVPTSGAV
ncbi:hypothetical protein E0Z10_g10224 [Xylaria hypoxylon]|uniref:Uncharacterized protein n=1 Tax=Xylaria hypoxylon TaxID=37992 RepID=A0A4Z0Y444_9PEZI|nr:hypothetical protein E0Z10_g10224 [Xylaria hypoxylon]